MKVDLWLANMDQLPDEDGSYLSEEEQVRIARFVHEKYQKHFIKRRSILRRLLSSYLSIKPNEIIIQQTELGKPYVKNEGTKIFISTSHSKNYVLYGFSWEAELGVDIEFLDAEIEAELISNHFFCNEEISLIRSSKGKRKSEAFFRLWCIKEAFIKMKGKGLTYPLDQVLVKNAMDNPSLEIPLEIGSQEILRYSVKYSGWSGNFGIGVVVEGDELELDFKIYE
ncbi:4'-phosphopantetheinyl transferase family protein [Cyclobacterium salsum]|uniref:4'-phosphopantetheinyl transferase family protein n=1 Tax=Cyclobacterium salsum TaxID=2666329 RepID=UPI00139147FC|nr:4'-phosphopantetheinyl transferase superfamily protein [Cyclobacterium salsum]